MLETGYILAQIVPDSGVVEAVTDGRWDMLPWIHGAASLLGFGFVVLLIMALFGHNMETEMNPQRRIAIARGQSDRRTPFEWPLTAPLMWLLWSLAVRLSVPSFKKRMKRALIAAGSPGYFTCDEYLALSAMIAISGAVVLLVADLLVRGHSSIATAMIGLLSAAIIAVYYPFDLARRRARQIGKQVPYTLDLISLAMGAGGSFVEAIETISAEAPDEPFNVELRTVLAEMELGSTRSKALSNLAHRIPLDALGGIIASIVQAEQLGTPLVEVLRNQAELLRRRRSVRAEKQAALASVRILLPSMVILLSVVLTIFAPIIIRAVRGSLFK